jgi:hypothetical protein
MHDEDVTTGWGNDEAKHAVRRTMRGGGSGRIMVFVIAAVCLTVGIYGRNGRRWSPLGGGEGGRTWKPHTARP